MIRAVDHDAMPAVGFTEPWSLRAGGRVHLHLSSVDPAPVVDIVRLDRPGLPGVGWSVDMLAVPDVRTLEQGSYLGLDLPGGDVALAFEVRLTRNAGARPILAAPGLALRLRDDGRAVLSAKRETSSQAPLPVETWCEVAVTRAGGKAHVAVRCSGRGEALMQAQVPVAPAEAGEWLIGADLAHELPTLNARIGRIRLAIEDRVFPYAFPARGMRQALFPDGMPDGPALTIRNRPTFACTSVRWDGTTLDPRVAPGHYDAIHLHDDDMDGLAWPATHAVSIPDDAEGGVYAFAVETKAGTERMPFFVRPRAPRADLAFLVPTATYLAYADEFLPQALYPWQADDRGHRFAQANGLKSPYDIHGDGSGVSLASTRRPRATLRDDAIYPLSGSPHLLPVDLHLLRFCAEQGIAVDLLTDHDLDVDGEAALVPYAGVLTGSHPEYWSIPMEAALRGYLARGGNLAYLGGNGFDTVVAFDGDLMELRRGSTPSHRTWDMRPGELHLALTGEPGGPLRGRGRGEHSLAGVGLTLMGFGPSRPFRRTADSHRPDLAWLFDGVEGEVFGTEGIVLGAAAGYEVDCTNARLGTPPETVVVATADGFGPEFIGDAGLWFEGGEPERAASRRAEMTLRTTPAGGIIFCASSVAWCGALPVGRPLDGAGQIMLNLLGRLGGSTAQAEPDRDCPALSATQS